jgi:hypothetical protein
MEWGQVNATYFFLAVLVIQGAAILLGKWLKGNDEQDPYKMRNMF